MSTVNTSLLTDANLRQYADEGYTVVRGLMPRELMAAVRDELLRIEAGDYDHWPPRRHFQFIDPRVVTCPNGKPLPLGVQTPATFGECFKSVADHPNLQVAMAGLLKGPVQRFTDQCGIKSRHIASQQGGCSYYHQDSYYWRIAPEHGCNVWIPCDTVGRDAIALAIKPGTQKSWTLTPHEDYHDDPAWGRVDEDGRFEGFKRHRVPLDQVDFSDEVLIDAEPGDAIFFTNFTWHRSEPNRSGRTKSFYAIAYRRSDVDQSRVNR